MNQSLATSLALAAATLFAAGCGKSKHGAEPKTASADDGGGQIECIGLNECKGQGSCKHSGHNECAGRNNCKGQGWVKMSLGDCQDLGGNVLK